MNALILAIIKMLQTLKSVVQKNEAKYTVIPAFSATFTEVTDLLTEMEGLQPVAVEKTNPTTEAVQQVKEQLAIATVKVCKPMKALANKLKDTVLLKLVSVNKTMLTKTPSAELAPICQNILDKATEMKLEAKNYNLTEAMLTEMGNLLTAYKKQSSNVSALKGEINTTKRSIEELAESAMELLRGQLDPMVATLEDTDATAVKLWTAARHITKPASTATELLAMVVTEDGEAMLPIADANFVAVNGKTFTAVTNAAGEAQMKPIPFGNYDLRCVVPGYVPFLLKNFKVVRGRVNKVQVKLAKAS